MTLTTSPRTPLSFDRIAYAYDDYNLHAPEISAQIGATIAQLTGPGALVLELGVGTGRIARPILDAGCRVIGLDISAEMMRKASEKGIAKLVRGSLLELPLRDASVDAVMVVHVLHHIADWRVALTEAMRVLRPGGLVIMGNDWLDPESCVRRMRGELRNAVIELRPSMKPPGAGAPYAQFMAKLGGTIEPDMIAAAWFNRASPAMLLERMASRVHQETWPLDDELLAASLARVRAMAEANWPDLEAEQEFERRFMLSLVRKNTDEAMKHVSM
jgi:ubiquinone/menaquinone biosynthesis C-methylase UbiE